MHVWWGDQAAVRSRRQCWVARAGQGRGWFLTPPAPRSLQHPNVLQCLGVCVETLPFLLIMEFCQLVRVCGGHRGGRGGLRSRDP